MAINVHYERPVAFVAILKISSHLIGGSKGHNVHCEGQGMLGSRDVRVKGC